MKKIYYFPAKTKILKINYCPAVCLAVFLLRSFNLDRICCSSNNLEQMVFHKKCGYQFLEEKIQMSLGIP